MQRGIEFTRGIWHAIRAVDNFRRLKPFFYIIGVQKGGTSSLFQYLRQHTDISLGTGKEIHYFDLNYSKGPRWYYNRFPLKTGKKKLLTGDATPSYLFHPFVAQRLHAFQPDAKLIVLLRDPITRAYSHYRHNVAKSRETLSFEDALKQEEVRIAPDLKKMLADPNYIGRDYTNYSYIKRGLYYEQIKQWREFFPEEQLLILKSEDFFNDANAICQQVHQFLGLTPQPLGSAKIYNKGKYDKNLEMPSPEIAERLRAYYTPFNQQLYDYLGCDFGWDSP